jgi:predicted RNA-binding Zn-ribbon protein involved in translation (DUF1610 family)
MPSHPDRVRKNYNSTNAIIIRVEATGEPACSECGSRNLVQVYHSEKRSYIYACADCDSLGYN